MRDWCRLAATHSTYIELGSPWQTPWVESFKRRPRDELLNVEEFGSLTEAAVSVESWGIGYHFYRPHSALGGVTPSEFAAKWTTQNQPAPS